MIDTLYIADFLEAQLNDNSLEKKFLVYADEGEMREGKRCCEYKYWTNCLVESVSSSIVPIKNIKFQTETLQLMFIVDLDETGETTSGLQDRKQSNNLIDVKTCIYEMIEALNGTTQTKTIGGKSYSVTLSFGSLTDGQKTQLGEVSEALPLYLSVTMSFFENGVNANDVHVYVNCEDLYFTRCVISKVNTADQNQFAGVSGGSKAYMLNSGKSIDLVLPTVSTNVGTLIMKDILDAGKNNALDVYITTPLYSKHFIGTLGNDSVSMDVGANLGYNVSIVEGKENLLNYSSNWVFFNVAIPEPEPVQPPYINPATLAPVIECSSEFSVDWGNGIYKIVDKKTNNKYSATGMYPNVESNYKVKVYKKNANALVTLTGVPIVT